MTKTDPIIAVKDVELSSKWYQTVFDCKSMHGGSTFDVLVNDKKEVMLCLHKWGAHEHPSMVQANKQIGNGIILYFRTENLLKVRQNARGVNAEILEDIELNPNSNKQEFSIKDIDGYYITIAEYHEFNG